MPSYKKHAPVAMIVAVASAVLWFFYQGWPLHIVHLFWALLWGAVGGLFPDVDTKSKIQRPFYWLLVSLIGYIAWKGYLTYALGVALAGYLPLLVHHRSLFHNFLLYVPLLVLPWFIPGTYFLLAIISFCAGVFSHLLLDRHC